MEEAPENGKESLHSAHANGMNEYIRRKLCTVLSIILILNISILRIIIHVI
jgi:hypothetical protein